MRRAGVVILFCFAAGLLLDSPTRGSEVTALKIRGKNFEPESKNLTYALWNESDQTITAWRLSLARSDPHGHAQKSMLDQDFFDLDGGEARNGSGPLAPGLNRSGQWRLDVGEEGSGPRALSLKVIAVIFEDSSWQGEQQAAESILAAREARIEEIGSVLSILESEDRRIQSREDWIAALRQHANLLRRQAEDPDQLGGSRREVAAQLSATRQELAQWLEEAGNEISLAPNPTETVGHLKGELERRYDIGMKAVQARKLDAASVEQQKGGGQ